MYILYYKYITQRLKVVFLIFEYKNIMIWLNCNYFIMHKFLFLNLDKLMNIKTIIELLFYVNFYFNTYIIDSQLFFY